MSVLNPPSHFKHRNPLHSVPSLTAARPASCGNPFQEFTASIWFHLQGAGISGRLQGFSSNYSLPCFYSIGFRFHSYWEARARISSSFSIISWEHKQGRGFIPGSLSGSEGTASWPVATTS